MPRGIVYPELFDTNETYIWARADGTEVEVSEVKCPGASFYTAPVEPFEDVGEVVTFVRPGRVSWCSLYRATRS